MSYQCAVIGDITLDRFLVLPQLDINPSDNNPGNFVVNLEIGHKILFIIVLYLFCENGITTLLIFEMKKKKLKK